MIMNSILAEDYMSVINDSGIPWKELDNKTVFVTGATGLIGRTLVKSLLFLSEQKHINVKVIAMARDPEKAKKVFADFEGCNGLKVYKGDIADKISYEGTVDHIVHGASITSSKMMVQKPADVIETAVNGTLNVLKFAKEKCIKGMVYLSSMEIYGVPDTDEKIFEDSYKYLDHLNVRSSYPESKKLAESLCAAYAKQYDIPVNIARLTQTFGAEVDFDDGRAFADFARCTALKQNIILHTKGETKRNYLYTADAVRAILYIMLKGKAAEAYNAANEATYCTVFEMAETSASLEECTKVEIQESDITQFGYAPTLKMNLSAEKLRALGWEPKYDLKDMFFRMIKYWKEEGKYEA